MYYQFYRYQSEVGVPRLDMEDDKELISSVKAKNSINIQNVNFEPEIVVSKVDDGDVTYNNESYPHAGSQFTSISRLSEASKKSIFFIFTVTSSTPDTPTDITFTINAFLNKMKATNAILCSSTLGTKAVAFSSHKVKWNKGNAPYTATIEVDFIDLSGLWRGQEQTITAIDQFIDPKMFRGYTFNYSFTTDIKNSINYDYWFANISVYPVNRFGTNFFLVLCPYSENAKQCIVVQRSEVDRNKRIEINNEYKTVKMDGGYSLDLFNTNSSFFKCSYSEHGTTKLFVACSHAIYTESEALSIRSSDPIIAINIKGVGYHVI